MYSKARLTIGPIAHRGIEADDVVQSAMLSFWKYSNTGKLADDLNRQDLWSLVAVFTANKARKHFRKENAAKRGGGKVVGEGQIAGDDWSLDELVEQTPTQEFDLVVEELLEPLDDEITRIVLLRLSGYTNFEIAELIGCSERKIERKLALTREIWGRMS